MPMYTQNTPSYEAWFISQPYWGDFPGWIDTSLFYWINGSSVLNETQFTAQFTAQIS